MPPKNTARIEFRTWTRADLALAKTLWCDERVMQFIGGPYSDDELEQRIARELANEDAHGVQYWPVFIDGAFAGACGLKPHDVGLRQFEIGFQFLPAFWGRGYAFEAARAVIDYAFHDLGITKLFAGRHPHNEPSATLLRKLGFDQIGTHFFARTGLDHPWYSLTSATAPAAVPAPRPA